jgi:hypothetical protein
VKLDAGSCRCQSDSALNFRIDDQAISHLILVAPPAEPFGAADSFANKLVASEAG